MTALANEDHVPDSRAMWRDGMPSALAPNTAAISTDYGDGHIMRERIGDADWSKVRRWRFGWAPV